MTVLSMIAVAALVLVLLLYYTGWVFFKILRDRVVYLEEQVNCEWTDDRLDSAIESLYERCASLGMRLDELESKQRKAAKPKAKVVKKQAKPANNRVKPERKV